MAAPYSDLGQRGAVSLLKLAGSGPISTGTQINIPSAFVQPTNPKNIVYPGCINASDFESVDVLGNYTPAFTIRTYAKTSWYIANLTSSLVLTTDSYGNTDQWAMQLKSQYSTRQWDLARCTGIMITHSATGGPLTVDMGFVSIYGDNDSNDPSPATFATPTTSPGSLINKGQITETGADQVKGWTLAMSRVQGYQWSDVNGLYAEAISSGGFSGSLMLTQSATYGTIPSSSVNLFTGSTGAGIEFALTLNLNEFFQPQDMGFVMHNAGYRLINLSTGGVPVVVSAM